MGAPVSVSAPRLKGKKGLSFSYVRHVYNTESKASWVDVRNKDGSIEAYDAQYVSVIKPKRKYTRRVK